MEPSSNQNQEGGAPKNQTLNDIIFAEQRKKIFYYLKKKTNIVELEHNNIKFNNTSEKKQDDSEEKENLKHPYFYMNQKEKKPNVIPFIMPNYNLTRERIITKVIYEKPKKFINKLLKIK